VLIMRWEYIRVIPHDLQDLLALATLTTPLIFLHPRSCADSHRFPTR
jgi:hypothetical protein